MTDTNDGMQTNGLTEDERAASVVEIENLIGEYSHTDVLCILLTVTVNAIHVIEDKGERKRIEEAYIEALHFLSAVEEQFHGEIVGETQDWVEECAAKMMRHVFRAIGLEKSE